MAESEMVSKPTEVPKVIPVPKSSFSQGTEMQIKLDLRDYFRGDVKKANAAFNALNDAMKYPKGSDMREQSFEKFKAAAPYLRNLIDRLDALYPFPKPKGISLDKADFAKVYSGTREEVAALKAKALTFRSPDGEIYHFRFARSLKPVERKNFLDELKQWGTGKHTFSEVALISGVQPTLIQRETADRALARVDPATIDKKATPEALEKYVESKNTRISITANGEVTVWTLPKRLSTEEMQQMNAIIKNPKKSPLEFAVILGVPETTCYRIKSDGSVVREPVGEDTFRRLKGRIEEITYSYTTKKATDKKTG